MRKLSLILAVLLALCSCAFAETAEVAEAAPIAAEDFLGLWNLEYAVADGIQVSAKAYGLTVTLTVSEDETAVLDYGDDNPVEMTWRIEENAALLTGYAEEDVEMVITEEGFLDIEDEIGKMRFSRPVEEEAE